MSSNPGIALLLIGLAILSFRGAASRAGEIETRVAVVRIPGVSNVAKAASGQGDTIHLVYDDADGPHYVKSDDGGITFAPPIAVLPKSAQTNGLLFSTWDLAVGDDGRVHVAMGSNAWKLKLPKEEWGLFYASLASGEKAFSPVRNLNHIPSEAFSIAANGRGEVTANFLSGKLYTMSSHDDGASFAASAEIDPACDPCKCCATSSTYGPDGRLALLYREETNNERDMYLVLLDRSGVLKPTRSRVSAASWRLEGCPMTYFTINPTSNGYLAVWPTKGSIYFARLDINGAVLPPGEIKTSGTYGIRTGMLGLSANDGVTLIAWKVQNTLSWQLYDPKGRPLGNPGSTSSDGNGAAGVVLKNGNFVLFP